MTENGKYVAPKVLKGFREWLDFDVQEDALGQGIPLELPIIRVNLRSSAVKKIRG